MRAGLGAARRTRANFPLVWNDGPSSQEYLSRSPKGMRAGLGAARRTRANFPRARQ